MDSIENSVFQIFSEETYVEYTKPWTISGHGRSSGTGFAVRVKNYINIANGWGDLFIMTNAHVVEHATYITVRKNKSSTLYIAKVESIAYECDLALLSIVGKGSKSQFPKDYDVKVAKEFWHDIKPLKFGSMPQKTNVIFAYGYPMGAENISISKGTINRIRILHYTTAAKGITIQTDTSINPGNSGGPALNSKDEVIGVVFATENPETTQGNAGFIIPTLLTEYFLKRVRKYKKFDGLCEIGVNTQNMQNSTLREFYNIEPYQTGILVTGVDPNSDAFNKVKIDDIILKIDNINIYYDGMIKLLDLLSLNMDDDDKVEFNKNFRMNDQVNYGTIVSLKMPNDDVSIELLRDGKIKKINVKTKVREFLIPILEYQLRPSYLMVGGLIFMPLSSMLIHELENEDMYINHLNELSDSAILNIPNQQVIILTNILRSELTEGYEHELSILSTVNSKQVHNLLHLQQLLKDAIKEKYVVFEFVDTNDRIVLKSDDIKKYTKQIAIDQLKTNITVLIP